MDIYAISVGFEARDRFARQPEKIFEIFSERVTILFGRLYTGQNGR